MTATGDAPITTRRAAAGRADVTVRAIDAWVCSGRLVPGPPWSTSTSDAAAAAGTYPRRGVACGNVESYRSGCSCELCLAAHRHERHKRAEKLFPAAMRARVLAALTEGELLPDVAAREGVSRRRIWGRARWDAEWSEQLEHALMTGRDPRIEHGGTTAYRDGRCFCLPCRARHAGPANWNGPDPQAATEYPKGRS